MMGCFSALEMACWDIIGKEAGKPVYKLLGGRVHEALRSYTYLYPHTGSVYPDGGRQPENVYNDPELAAECAARMRRAGLHCGEVRSCRALYRLRRTPAAAGRHRSLGAHGEGGPRGGRHALPTSCSARMASSPPSGALRMARAIEPYDPLWFEEPVPPDHARGDGAGRARHLDPGRDRRAADDQVPSSPA